VRGQDRMVNNNLAGSGEDAGFREGCLLIGAAGAAREACAGIRVGREKLPLDAG